MKNNSAKYLLAICHALGLSSGTSNLSAEHIARAIQLAAGTDFKIKLPYQPVALRPILETVGPGQKSGHWFPAEVLSLTPETFFPKKEKPDAAVLQKQLLELTGALQRANEENYLTCLHYYGSTLAISDDLPDIPLYDFIKTAASILQCLEQGNGKLRLAGGSISGIQSYLYDIVSKRAGKLLKGRSFYLQLLSDSLAERFLEFFHLTDMHIVYSSGGGFYVLLPDYDNVESDFEDFKSVVIRLIYEVHKTNLFCEFALSKAFDEGDSINGVDGIWDSLIKAMNVAKNQRLSHNNRLLQDLLGVVDEGGDDIEDSEFVRDAVTNEQIKRVDAREFDEDGNLVHWFTNAQKQLGEDLRDAKFWISDKRKFNDKCFPDPLGYFHLLDDKKRDWPQGTKVRALNDLNAGIDFVLYGGNKIPVHQEDFSDPDGNLYRKGAPKTFDQLAAGAHLKRQGILRMDVDKLGQIFSEYIGHPVSFTRYAAVSRALDWFFKGYLNTIHAEMCKTSGEMLSDRTIIIYSGGDDLFVVGRWLEALELGCRIYEDFNKWSGGNLTISGGLAILPDKFPVMQGSNLASDQEKAAKGYTLDDQVLKNAICFFDHSLNWEKEMPIIFELKNRLSGWLKAKKVDNSILKKIDQHAESRKEWEVEMRKPPERQNKERMSPRWIWNMVYDFGRLAGRTSDGEIAAEIRILASDATFGDHDFKQKIHAVPMLYLLQTAARWVELEQRTLTYD